MKVHTGINAIAARRSSGIDPIQGSRRASKIIDRWLEVPGVMPMDYRQKKRKVVAAIWIIVLRPRQGCFVNPINHRRHDAKYDCHGGWGC